MNKIRYLIPLLSILLMVAPVRAQLNIQDTMTDQELVEQVLLGTGVQVYNITSTGDADALGTFSTGPTTFPEIPMDYGIIMSTGNISSAVGPNNSGGTTTQHNQPGDPDITNILGGTTTRDAAVLEFDFKSPADTVRFNYIFASEEYSEYVCDYNDAFAFLLSGPNPLGGNYNKHNIALVPGTSTEVAIKTVNNGDSNSTCAEEYSNQEYYVDNGTGSTPAANPNVEYDGLTKVFTAIAVVVPCEEYHIKLVIADANDQRFDSAVFLEANSFGADVDTLIADYTYSAPGCTNDTLQFLNAGPTGAGITWEWTFGGGATPATSTEENPIVTWSTPGIKRVDMKTVINCGMDSAIITKYVTVYERPDAYFTFPDNICAGNPVQFTNNGSSGSEFSHEWTFTSDAQPSEAYTENPLIIFSTPGDKPIKHTVYNDHCSHTTTDTITILPRPEADFTHTGPACISQNIDFTNTGSSEGVSFNWSFSPDGSPATSNLENPTGITFSTPGIKSATLVVTDNLSGCQDSISKTFEILDVPVADFTFTNNVCIGTGIDFTNTGSTGNEYSYSWDFGSDASTSNSTAENPQNIAFSSSGNHTISLSVSNSACIATTTQTLTVENSPAPEVSFASTAPACGNDPVDFSFDGDASGLVFNWNFGFNATPATSTNVNPSGIVFDSEGTQSIVLTVTDVGSGCWNEAKQTINIYQNPIASFTFTDSICIGASLDFTNTGSTGNEFSYSWDFGTDAAPSTSNAENPSGILYSSGGNKIVTFTVSTPYCTETLTDTVVVKNSPQPEIDFTSTAPDCENDEITFTILNYDPQFNYSWDFGAGANPATSTAAEPVVTYSLPGTKIVKLYAVHPLSGCNNELSKTINIYDDPIASFTFTDSICIGTNINFTNTGSTGNEFSYSWDFGTDANPSVSTAEHPSGISYTSSGDKLITLTVSTSHCTESYTDTLHIQNSPAPVIDFSSTAPACEANEVAFSIDDYDASLEYNWDFGIDATPPVSSDSEPVVVYSSPGIKIVSLFASNPQSGCSNQISKTINIHPRPDVSFTSTAPVCIGQTVDFSNEGSSGAEYQYTWDFGESASPSMSNAENPTGIVYSSSGDKEVSLSISDGNCTRTVSQTISISESPFAEFETTAPKCTGIPVYMHNLSDTANTLYHWNFGENATPQTSNAVNPFVIYNEGGSYEIKLMVTKLSTGCKDSVRHYININPTPEAEFSVVLSDCPGEPVAFINEGSSGFEFSYLWDFGVSAIPNTSQAENPSGVIFTEGGMHRISFTIMNNECTNTINDAITLPYLPDVNAGVDTTICANRSIQLGVPGLDNYSYNWFPSSTLDNANVAQPIASPEAEFTTYHVTVTDNNTGCINTDSVHITMLPPALAKAGPDVTICRYDSIQIGTGMIEGQSYYWYPQTGMQEPDIANPKVSPPETITYTLYASYAGCDTVTDEVTVTVHQLPEIDAGENRTIARGEQVQLNATGGVNYIWSPLTGINHPYIPNPVVSPDDTITYKVTGNDVFGCTNTDSVTIFVIEPQFYIPNSFTPNDDNLNDVFYIRGEPLDNFELRIINRQNQSVFISKDYYKGWDGRIQGTGEACPVGAYVYIVTGINKDGKEVKESGIVNLIR